MTYIIKIYKDGVHVDTQTVEASTEDRAITRAMAQTKVRMMGALASYEGREESETEFRPFVRDF